MNGRNATVCRFLLFAVAIFAFGVTSGCGYTQQSKYQMSFLPPAPIASPTVELPDPPALAPNLYLGSDIPAIVLINPQILQRRTQADNTMLSAQRRFQAGRRAYQSQDLDTARREFDRAIDLMLEASEQEMFDRPEFERKLDEMVDSIHRFDLAELGSAAVVDQGKFEKVPLEDILQMTFPVDPKMKDKVREQVASSTSQLPLSVNDAVLGYINYFSNRGHRTLLAGLQRSGRFRPMIQRILDEEGVPQEIIHLAQAESGFIPRAVSRAAAGGMWQFLKWRGNEYGLKQTAYTDDRMDPEKATRAAAHHLRDLYHEFGDWYLAIAAYNCGPGTVEKAVERTGYADFWELRARGVLPAETTNYVPIILAMTIMEKNASEYGIEGFQLDPPLEYDTVETSAPTSLTLVADVLDIPFAELAALNPASLRGMVPENFSVHVPKGSGNQLVAALQLIPSNRMDAWRMHRVGPGETLAVIGKRYAVPASYIVSANRLESAQAVEGDRLLIPSAQRALPPVVQKAGQNAGRKPGQKVVPKAAPKAAVAAVRRRPAARRKAATNTASALPVRKRPAATAHNATN
jgi:membrane-bound lytic murein transglycosylase D